MTGGGLTHRLRRAYGKHVDYRREAALRTLVSFLITFLFLRGLTYGIHYHLIPVRDIVTSGGLHIHHYVWGIFIVLVVGFLALSMEQARWHPWLAIPFGFGAALILDEFALLLNLQDVYWATKGRASVDAVIVVAAALGMYLAAYRFWNAAGRQVMALVRDARGWHRPAGLL